MDSRGRLDELHIDFEAIAAHLSALEEAARGRGIHIAKVVFDPTLRRQLAKTRSWKHISGLPFTKSPVWVRHDDNYPVDFAVPCAPRKE